MGKSVTWKQVPTTLQSNSPEFARNCCLIPIFALRGGQPGELNPVRVMPIPFKSKIQPVRRIRRKTGYYTLNSKAKTEPHVQNARAD
jgi:hypothetical protein